MSSPMTAEALNPNSKIPLYYQLYTLFQDKIRSSAWKPGDMIPPESELVDRFKISRVTVRKVMDMLVKEGFLVRERGRGSYVAHPKLEHGTTRIVSFTADMKQRGLTPSTTIIFTGLVEAPAEIAEKLKIPVGEQLARIDRLRLADEEPMCVEESFLVHRHVPGILGYDFSVDSLREIKEKKYGILWSRAMQTIQAIPAPLKIARLLTIRPGAALLYFDRVTFSQNDIPMEYLRVYYRADRYVLHNELIGGAR